MKNWRNVNSARLLSAILCILVGALFLVWRGAIISAAITVVGAMLIASAIVCLVRKNYTACVINAVFGVLILAFGHLFLSAALYLLGAVLMIYGILLLIEVIRCGLGRMRAPMVIVRVAQPLLCIFAAACLFLNQGGAVDWVFILSGFLLIVQGVLALGDAVGLK